MSRVDEAFDEVKRKGFLPPEIAESWQQDVALPIGYMQTNSQPYTVRLMLERLAVEKGDRVLDVGSGSGWTTALLAHIVGKNGEVYAVERILELVEFGHKNCRNLEIKNVIFHQAGQVFGLPEKAPFDRILVSACAHEIPMELVAQLKIGGKMVVPVNYDILEITKKSQKDLTTSVHSGFVFVPLVKP